MSGQPTLLSVATLLLCTLFLAPPATISFTTTISLKTGTRNHYKSFQRTYTHSSQAQITATAATRHAPASCLRDPRWCVAGRTWESVRMTRIMSSSEAAEAAAAAEVAAAEAVGVSDGGGVVREVDPHVTELPDSFQDSVVRMGKCTLQALNEGLKLLRVDFDTSAGDETYTTLKSSLEMAKQFTKLLAEELICGTDGKETGDTMTLFFPDAGSAALAKYEWGVGTEAAEVPAGVRFCTVKTQEPADTDVGCILLCPRNSEADFALELVRKVDERGQFMVLINPALINMGTTGYGLAGRRIRDEIISAFCVAYYLRTLPWGAVTREHGKKYTVWQDDSDDPTGYRLLKTVTKRPVGEALDDIYNIANGLQAEDETPEFLNTVAKFVRDFGTL